MEEVVRQLIDSDTLNPSDDFNLLKTKNKINLNILQGPLETRLTQQAKEELKHTIIDKIERKCIPNFVNEFKMAPSYERLIS